MIEIEVLIESVVNSMDVKPKNFIHGTPTEILNRLIEMGNSSERFKKFPLIALIHDIDQNIDGNTSYDVKLNIVIANATEPNYSSHQRLTKNIIPILQPLYESFLKSIDKSGYFVSRYTHPHTKVNRMYWGRSDNKQNKTTDYLDAIELQSLELKVKKNICTNNLN